MSEKAIVGKIRRYLKSIGAKTEKQHGTIFGRNGVPDILGSYQGRALALEVKKPGEEPSSLQRKELREWAAAGAIAAAVDSLDQVKKLLKQAMPCSFLITSNPALERGQEPLKRRY